MNVLTRNKVFRLPVCRLSIKTNSDTPTFIFAVFQVRRRYKPCNTIIRFSSGDIWQNCIFSFFELNTINPGITLGIRTNIWPLQTFLDSLINLVPVSVDIVSGKRGQRKTTALDFIQCKKNTRDNQRLILILQWPVCTQVFMQFRSILQYLGSRFFFWSILF